MNEFFAVGYDGPNGRAVLEVHATEEAAIASATKRAVADTAGTSRFHVLKSTGYFGKPVVAPEWHPADEAPARPRPSRT